LLHQLHTFGKYAQRTRTHRHGITRNNPNHCIVHIQPSVQNVARSQKASMHNAPNAGRATWEQETCVVQTSSPRLTIYEYSASIYSRPIRQQDSSSICSRRSTTAPVVAHPSSRTSQRRSQEWPDIPGTTTSPVGSAEREGKVETYSSDGGSNASSIKRRGAVRRHANPLFARPVADDFERNQVIGKDRSP
jgi:hypothetical protein